MTTVIGPAATALAPARRPPVPARPRWWGVAIGLVVWATALVVIGLWVSNGGAADLTAGSGEALTSLGRLTGLVSSDMLLLQVLAMARIPWVERSIGQDRVTRWHRLLGFTSVNLLLAHAVLITLGYAALDTTGFLAELWSLITTAPGMLLATAGTGLLVLIAVTAIRAARRRLRYESWHLLHLYAYLGAGLALPHQLWTGADFLASPVATAYWWTLYGLALVSVLVYRVVLPLRTSLRHALVVSAVVHEAPGVVSVHVTGRRLDELAVAAGQFFVWRFRSGPGWTRGHPLSLSAAPTGDSLRITLSVRGDDGPRLAALRPGTRVLVEGPFGRLTPDVRTRPALVAIGSGLGIAPLVSLLQDAHLDGRLDPARGGRPAALVRRIRSAEPQPLQADIDRLVQAGELQVIDLVGPRSTGGSSWLPAQLGHLRGSDVVRRLVPDLADADVFVCGAAPWAEAIAGDLRAAGLPADALHVERFSW